MDGDTVDLLVDLGFRLTSTQRFRLLDVDCPELRGEERERGLEAKNFVQGLLPVGAEVVVVSEKTGKWGRWLARIWVDGLCVNDELVRHGHLKDG